MEENISKKRTLEEECILDMEEGVNETEVFDTEKFSVLPFVYFGKRVYRIRKIAGTEKIVPDNIVGSGAGDCKVIHN